MHLMQNLDLSTITTFAKRFQPYFVKFFLALVFRMPSGKQSFMIDYLKLNVEFPVNVNVAPIVSLSVAGTQLSWLRKLA